MIFDLLFRVGPAIQAIFALGFEPKEEFFFEVTCDQYEKLEAEGFDISKTWYTLLAEDPALETRELQIADADEKQSLLDAADYINNVFVNDAEAPQGQLSYDEKLRYVASRIPPVFSEDTKYAHDSEKKPPNLKLV